MVLQVYEIDLSDNCLSTDRSLEEVAQIVSRLRPERLALNNCDIENVTKLQESRKSKRVNYRQKQIECVCKW